MNANNSSERVKLCAARSLGLAENQNDATVLIDSLTSSGIIDISIPEQLILKSISGEEFLAWLEKAITQFDDDGSWIDLSREEVEKRGGVVDDLRKDHAVFYRIANPDGSIPNPPTLNKSGDPVNHPDHYGGKDNPYEVIKVIEHWRLGFHLGNTVKYIARAGKKGNTLEDLKKARWYLDRHIEGMESPE